MLPSVEGQRLIVTPKYFPSQSCFYVSFP